MGWIDNKAIKYKANKAITTINDFGFPIVNFHWMSGDVPNFLDSIVLCLHVGVG